jgi:23S rRNA pseudouridine2605 synthase
MRLNQFIAKSTDKSRRAADELIINGLVYVNGVKAELGQDIKQSDSVFLNSKQIFLPKKDYTIILNKPKGIVVSKNGQGNLTIYDILPDRFQKVKPAGRLDRESSGILVLSTDGNYINKLTHPKYHKEKIYEIEIDRDLAEIDKRKIENGVKLEDGISKLELKGLEKKWKVKMHEGKNRQIRITFLSLGYNIKSLHRTKFGDHELGKLPSGHWIILEIMT